MTDDNRGATKRERTYRHIADVAASLFAARGYDAVSMLEVARACDVSEQTVYNHFSSKHELVLDIADVVRDRYRRAITERGSAPPAAVMAPLVEADVERYRTCDLDEARGQFLAQSVASPVLRRYALEERQRQTQVVGEAILATTPGISDLLAHAHAAALVAVVQLVGDRLGAAVLARDRQDPVADEQLDALRSAFAALGRTFSALVADTRPPSPGDGLARQGVDDD